MTTESQMQDTKYRNGFTLAELLIALMVTSIILAAVATLAYAMSSANKISGDTSQKQAQVRFATLRISELIRHSKLILKANDDDLAVWRADDNGDGKINANELVYIEAGQNRDYLRLLEFPSAASGAIPLNGILGGTEKPALVSNYGGRQMVLLPVCSNVQFYPANIDQWSKSVTISFGLSENGVVRQYQIEASLRGWAGNLLDGSGNIVSDDD
ncbi:MAG TPA: type II secretion system protein [Phycisphaerales bacterium]|nr:type II secretion system protein [Phycisphaerales bacterium]